jgi:hypothetical protein
VKSAATAPIPRYLPAEPLPPYAFVPGKSPHPTRSPAGHSFGRLPAPPARLDPGEWAACRAYLYGIDLFNHGYYWEAHEAWESLWRACRREPAQGDFLRALIRLAAAGVKAREGNLPGAGSHAAAAAALFRGVADGFGHERYMGMAVRDLCRCAVELAAGEGLGPSGPGPGGDRVLAFALRPE